MASDNENVTAIERFEELMSLWRAERNQPDYLPDETLASFAELFEEQINAFYRVDPDPLDDRHPLKTDSTCELGQLLRLITTHDSFFIRLTDYLCSSDDPGNSTVQVAARLLCSIQYGVTVSFTVAESDLTVNTLYKLAMRNSEPTNCYALLLLGSILDNPELLYVTKQRNVELVSVVLRRMGDYAAVLEQEIRDNPVSSNDAGFGNRLGSFCLEPMTVEMKLRLCISYLTSLAEYQDMMPFMYDGGVLRFVYKFLEPDYSARDIRLTFEALRLLANLLCHRCIHLDFVESRGLELLLRVPRPSVAATAVSVVLYYTAYFEDAMERVCTLRSPLLNGLMKYSLWLVECAHPSARCYALYFLSIALCYGATFRIFKENQGLRYLYNALCVLPIRLTEDESPLQKDSTSWHVVRASLQAIRRYLDISLLVWMDELDPTLSGVFDEPPKLVAAAGNRLINYTTEQMNRLLALVVSRMRPHTVFHPILELANLCAIPVLFRVIARNAYAHSNWPGRNECTRVAVDILNTMCLSNDLADDIVGVDVYTYPGGAAFSTINSLLAAQRSPRHRGRLANLINDIDDSDVDDNGSGGGGDGEELRVIIGGSTGFVLHRGTAERGNRAQLPNNQLSRSARRLSGTTTPRRNLPIPTPNGVGEGDIDRLADEPSSDERINGLLMLFTLARDDDGWDVAVQKAILSFIGTLVYRPIDEREHPDQPVLASSVIPQHYYNNVVGGLESPQAVDQPMVPLPKTPTARTSTRPGVSSSRKRRLDDPHSYILGDYLSTSGANPYRQVIPTPILLDLRFPTSAVQRRHNSRYQQLMPQLLMRQERLWAAVRRQHGLMLLLNQLEVTHPISEADSVRTLACRGLVGLARSEEVRTMLAKLPLFTKSQLQLLMKEPVLPDRIVEHGHFCRHATLLMRLVLGCLSDGSLTGGDMSMDRVRRAVIVAKTRIQWDQEELLEIVWRHLQSSGLHKSAAALLQEARLRIDNHMPPLQLPLFSRDTSDDSEPPCPPPTSQASLQPTSTSAANQSQHRFHTSCSGDHILGGLATSAVPSLASCATLPATPTLRVNKIKPAMPTATPKGFRDRLERPPAVTNLYLKQTVYSGTTVGLPLSSVSASGVGVSSPFMMNAAAGAIPTLVNADPPTTASAAEGMTLNRIVESFLLHQHAQCPYPVSVCPRFSLHKPHRCPEPRPDSWGGEVSDVPHLVLAREALVGCHRMRCSTRKFVRRFIHSRFTPAFSVRDLEDEMHSAVAFSRGYDEGLFLGTSSGSVCWVNGEEGGLPIELFRAQTSLINHIEHSRDGRRLLVCADWGEPALLVAHLLPTSEIANTANAASPWTTNLDDLMFRAEDARYAEFSRSGLQDKIVATYGKVAKVFDLATGQRMVDLFSSTKQSDYIMNKATFSVDDRLVLNDGVLWDLRSASASRPVHKIDKFQNIVSGVFHPNGLEVVVGSAVWDIRTWRLLHTVQALDKLEAKFSENSEVIYAGLFGLDYDDMIDEWGQSRLAMQSMFRTVDSLDYSLIASVDVKHRIEHLALAPNGLHLALIEYAGEKGANESITQCRLYSVGRKRSDREVENAEDEDEEDEEDDHRNDDGSDDDDDDDDNDGLIGSSSSSSTSSSTGNGEEDSSTVSTDDASWNSHNEGGGGSESSWLTEEEMEVTQQVEGGGEEEGAADLEEEDEENVPG